MLLASLWFVTNLLVHGFTITTTRTRTAGTSLLRRMSSAPSDSASLDDESDDFREQGYTAAAATSTTTWNEDDENNENDAARVTSNLPTTTAGMISKLFELLPNPSFIRNLEKDETTRSTMNELIVKLEKRMSTSPTTSTGTSSSLSWTTSPLLNGVWELRYVGGYTPKAPFNISPTRQLALFLYSGGYSPGVRSCLCLCVCVCV
jgi:hypothetical protein